MKKVFVYAMGLAALLAVSCNNKDNSATPEAPATQEWAQLIKFSEPVQIGAYAFQSVELTESSRYIAEYVTSKASAGANILYGKYTYANGTFTLDGLGSLKIDGNQVTINPSSAGGSPVQVPATITRPSAKDQTAVNACRNWSISKIIIGISGKTKDGNTVEGDKMFNKLDLKEFADFAKRIGLEISDEDLEKISKYNVKEICMTSAGSFVVEFASVDPFYGTLSLNGSNFTFTLSPDDFPILSGGKITGTLNFSGSTCILEAAASLVYNEVTYSATLNVSLTEVK